MKGKKFGGWRVVHMLVRAAQAVVIAIFADMAAKDEASKVALYTVGGLVLLLLIVLERAVDELIRRDADDEKRSNRDRLHARLSVEQEGAAFLIATYRLTTRAVLGQRRLLESGAMEPREIKKHQIVADTLRQMCRAMKEAGSLEEGIPITDVIAKATFMEVTGPPGNEVLTYVAWWTPSGAPPRSLNAGVTFARKVGCAGLAWDRARPVIENDFNPGEWTNSYEGQGELYRSQNMSMVSVPVVASDGASVIGVITVDVNLREFFGKKSEKNAEERAGKWLLPYASYISFIYAAAEFVPAAYQKFGLSVPTTTAILPIPTAPEPVMEQ